MRNNNSPRTFFHRRDDRRGLCAEDVYLADVAATLGTPLYVYSAAAIEHSYRQYAQAFTRLPHLICVSVKANGNLSLLNLLARLGAGFDIVSGGELERVIRARGSVEKVVFSGVGKTDQEIALALDRGILIFNVESSAELERINQLALAGSKVARVSIRVNPNVDSKTHHYVSTGLLEHKFGISLPEARELYRRADLLKAVQFVGIDCHIGSMLTDLNVFRQAFSQIRELFCEMTSYLPSLRYIDLGGGLAVSYDQEKVPSVAEYADLVREVFSGVGATFIVEPGRYIFANAGVLVSKVLYLKHQGKKTFAIIDAGLNDFLRPALYQAYHEIEPLMHNKAGVGQVYDVVGPVCETSDCFATGRSLSLLNPGDLVVIYGAGAYGFSMASHYNSRPKPAEVLISGNNFRVIRSRESFAAIVYDEEALMLKE